MILLIDNYDSFSYNLYQMIGELEPDIRAVRNDAVSVRNVKDMRPSSIILSPGPGRPADAGICEELVLELGGQIPILGVCLGHQAICEAYGAQIVHAAALMHGKQSLATLDPSCPLFQGLPGQIPVARYHSLAVREDSIPQQLLVTAVAQDGEIMGIRHREYPVFGLQFHPESILTPNGKQILKNYVRFCTERRKEQV